MSKKEGYSLLEFMIVLALLSLLATGALFSLLQGIRRQALETATLKVREALVLAKSLSMEKGEEFCVLFEKKSALVFHQGITETLSWSGAEIARTTFRSRHTGTDTVCFSSLGAPFPAGRVVLSNQSGKREVVVSIGTGRIRVTGD